MSSNAGTVAGGAAPPIGEVGDPPERVRGRLGERERRDRAPLAVAAQLRPGHRPCPRKHATTGLSPAASDADAIARATSCAAVTSGGTKIASSASMPSSCSAIRSACSNCSAVAPATRSIGIPDGCVARDERAQRVWVGSLSSGTSSPAPAHASAARMPGTARVADDRDAPARREAVGARGACAVASSSSSVSTRITPAWRNSASTATSGEASAAVCDDAARRPAGGASALDRDDRLACARSDARAGRTCAGSRTTRGSSRITSVFGSSSQYCSRSLPLTSALLPTETKSEMPIPRLRGAAHQLDPETARLRQERDRPAHRVDAARTSRSCARPARCSRCRGSSAR